MQFGSRIWMDNKTFSVLSIVPGAHVLNQIEV